MRAKDNPRKRGGKMSFQHRNPMQCMIREEHIVKIIKGNVVRLLLQHSVLVFREEMISVRNLKL